MAVHSNMELGMEMEQYTRGVSMNDVDEDMDEMEYYDQQMDEPMDMDSPSQQMDQDQMQPDEYDMGGMEGDPEAEAANGGDEYDPALKKTSLTNE